MRPPEITGHQDVLERYSEPGSLPPALLLTGPASVGKFTVAAHLARLHAPGVNALVLRVLTADAARDVRRFAGVAPLGPPGTLKAAALRLDGATGSALEALLKELEEPPGWMRYVLSCAGLVLPTIASRCQRARLRLLSTADVAEIAAANGCGPAEARRMAAAAGGRVGPALGDPAAQARARAAVAGFARALAQRDADLMDKSLKGWGAAEDRLLWAWLTWVATGQPSPVFSAADRYGLGRREAGRVITLWAQAGDARPGIAIRAVAAAAISG